MPTAPTRLLPVLATGLPHKSREREVHCLALRGVFALAASPAGAPLGLLRRWTVQQADLLLPCTAVRQLARHAGGLIASQGAFGAMMASEVTPALSGI